ncbi:MAG TPA: PQQ-binding-like beta-propeller repeat protein, partial [Planctomycetota bacterium]|nr:PQQ-binding-like beta-propeller repeat protein [Planctomycetota bacterium]
DGKELFVVCVDKESGKVLVDHKLFTIAEPTALWEKYNSYASPTPVIEEGRLYVTFGTYGTVCLDTKAGKVLWVQDKLHCDHWRGAGSSPILFQNLLILTFDGYDVQYLAALDKKTGKVVWKSDRKHDYGTTDGDQKKGYSTPTIIEVGGKPQLVTTASAATTALDPMTGEILWTVSFKGCHSPACRIQFAHGLVYTTTGTKGEILAIKPDGKGDVTATHIAWRAKGAGHKGSPLIVGDLIYVVNEGAATCLDAKTGAVVWTGRVEGKSYSASPLYADGAIYFFSDGGAASVVQPGRELKELGKGKLETGGAFKSTPAIVGKSIYLRSDTHLYRIEKK